MVLPSAGSAVRNRRCEFLEVRGGQVLGVAMVEEGIVDERKILKQEATPRSLTVRYAGEVSPMCSIGRSLTGLRLVRPSLGG